MIICYEIHMPLHLVARYIRRSSKQINHILKVNVPQVMINADMKYFVQKSVKNLLQVEDK